MCWWECCRCKRHKPSTPVVKTGFASTMNGSRGGELLVFLSARRNRNEHAFLCQNSETGPGTNPQNSVLIHTKCQKRTPLWAGSKLVSLVLFEFES